MYGRMFTKDDFIGQENDQLGAIYYIWLTDQEKCNSMLNVFNEINVSENGVEKVKLKLSDEDHHIHYFWLHLGLQIG